MNDEKYKRHLTDFISLIKEKARKSKKDEDNPEEGFEDYNKGVVMGYYSIITLLKHQAFAFCMDQKELGLADINPDVDLLGLHRNLEMDFGEDNWEIDVMNEERVKGYFIDFIYLLKEQVREAKSDADNPEKDSGDYNQGILMAYSSVIFLLKHQVIALNKDEDELGLADIEPERDLL